MKHREIALLKQDLHATITLPGSKSITNRALLCAALAQGKSRIFGALDSDDTRVMLTALKQLGIKIEKKSTHLLVHGKSGKFAKKALTLDLHNAGTATRFLTAIMVLRSADTIITGDKRMQERPIQDLVDGLTQLGAHIQYLGNKGCPPLKISARQPTTEKNVIIKMKGSHSSQYFSALLILAPLLAQKIRIEVVGDLVSKPYIDTTIAVLKAFGVKVKNDQYRSFEIKPQSYQPADYYVEGDASAATYFSSLAFLHAGTLTFTNLNYRKSIQGDVNYPAALALLNHSLPTSLRAKRGNPGSPNFSGLPRFARNDAVAAARSMINMNAMPDAAMTLAVTAAFIPGNTKITGLSTLRIKETDRLAALKNELIKVGIRTTITKDSITIFGKKNISPTLSDIAIDTYNDHRMAMCFAVAGTLLPSIVIENPHCTDKTYPEFWQDLAKAYLAPFKPGKKHIVLTGMRGVGKSHLGKKIARILQRPFLDIDLAIEKEAKMSIKEMVAQKGWPYFRELERQFCARIALDKKYNQQPMVIATGGGCVMNPDNMRHLKKNAINILVFADPQVIVERVALQNQRPSLQAGRKVEKEIYDVWQQRRELYYQYADRVWDNTEALTDGQLKVVFGC